MLIRRLLPFLCAFGLLLGSPALADTTISNSTSTPLKTSTSEDINITGTGSVSIDEAGAAVTVDSDNTLIVDGAIVNKAKTGAIGVLLNGGGEESGFSLGGTINLTGKDAEGGIGVEVAPGGFTGDVILRSGSSMVVTGDQSTGLAIFGPLVGEVALSGTVIVTGEGATGMLTTAPITGSITIGGTLRAQGTETVSTKEANPESGSALAIGGSVSDGIVIVGPDSVHPTFAFSTVVSFGSAPTVYISPTLAGAAATDLNIGIYADPDNLNEGFSLLNRGTIGANGLDPGVDALALLIEGDGTHTATLEGGIFNGHIISALAHSGDKPDDAEEANAIAIEIGDGGIVGVPTDAGTKRGIVNAGTIAAQTTGFGGGSATAIQVDEGGTLESLNNSGKITADATLTETDNFNGTLFACAICDYSGTLTSLINSGTITASATELDDGSQVTIAADLSHAAAGTSIVFLNSGDVTGDVLFGASDDRLGIGGGGALLGDVSFGAGTNNLDIVGVTGSTPEQSVFSGTITYDAAGGGTLDIDVGANGTLRTPSADATSLNVASGGAVIFVLGPTGPAPGSNEGIITTTGNVVFAGGSTIGFGFDSSLPDGGNYTLVYAGSGISFGGDPDNPVKTLSAPFLYNLDIDFDIANPNELVADFQRKTAAELHLEGNQASLYGAGAVGTDSYVNSPLMQAARTDEVFGAALMGLFKEEAVDSALNSLMPDISGDTRAIAVALTDQSTGAVGARQRTLTSYANSSAEMSLWGQEYVHYLTNSGESDAVPGYDGRGFGFTLGLDGGSPRNGRFGGGITFFGGNVTENEPRHSKTNIEWYMFSLYSNWRGRGLFFNTQANGGYGTFDGTRVIQVGTLRRRATGSWSDYLASGGVSTGFIFTTGSLVFSPMLNVDALYVRENAYDEGGAGGENLSIDSRTQKSLRTFLGFQLRENFDLNDGYFQPELRGGWSYDFLNDPEEITAAFSQISDPLKFTLTGPIPEASRFVGGTSITWAYRSWSLGFNYDLTASSGAYAHSGTVTLTGRI